MSWITASPVSRGFVLRLHRVEDVGSDTYCDVTEFPPIGVEEYVGEGREILASKDLAAILQTAADQGAVVDRWVNQGVVCDEYLDSRRDA